jgi:prepilin-type N-terminal cleavage/methylation domain-containing protein
MNLLTTNQKRNRRAFTLIEMIGVLAVIAILAAVLIPKVFTAINNARVNNAAMSIQTVKTACVDHYSKYGSILAGPNGTTYGLGTGYDTNLLAEGFLDKPFLVRIGDGTTNTTVKTISLSSISGTVDGTDTTGFDLAGIGTNNVTGSVMVVAEITGVEQNDAKDLNDRIDGTSLGADPTTANAADLKGRVKYASYSGTPTNSVYIYLTHL